MPLREYRCPHGHVTERILTHAQDEQTPSVPCSNCSAEAERVEISLTGVTIFAPGCGGFHKPSIGALTS